MSKNEPVRPANHNSADPRHDPDAALKQIKEVHEAGGQPFGSFLLDGHFFPESPWDDGGNFAALTTLICEFFWKLSQLSATTERKPLTSKEAGKIGQLRGALTTLEREEISDLYAREEMNTARRIITDAMRELGYRENPAGAPVQHILRALERCLFAAYRARGDTQTNAAKETARLIRLWEFPDPPPWGSVLQRCGPAK